MVKHFLLSSFTLFVAGCYTIGVMDDLPVSKQNQQPSKSSGVQMQIIEDKKAESLASAVATWNREKLDTLIEEDELHDPVLLVAEGNFLLHEGNAEDAGKLFIEALSLVNENQFVCSQKSVRLQAPPEQNKNSGNGGMILSEDKQILQSARDAYLQKTSNAEALQIMATRTASIPYPPTFRGTMGLCFEIIAQYMKKNYFFYRFAAYPVVKNDTVRGIEVLRKTIAINIVVAGLLSENNEILQSGLTVLQSMKKPDSEASFFIGLASYFLGTNEDYLKFFDNKTKQLFTTL